MKFPVVEIVGSVSFLQVGFAARQTDHRVERLNGPDGFLLRIVNYKAEKRP